MKAILKNFSVSSWTRPGEFRPDNPHCFGVWLTAEIGPDEAEGTEHFQIFVCNVAWLERGPGWIPEHGALDPRQRYIVVDDTYDDGSVKERLEGYLRGCDGRTWKEVVAQVSKIGFSEFEDYRS